MITQSIPYKKLMTFSPPTTSTPSSFIKRSGNIQTMFNNSHDFYINNLFAVDGNSANVMNVSQTLPNVLMNSACLGAGHQSAERFDAPKCHPDTRAAVMHDIMSWVNSKESKEPVMWLSGPAGAGKSAIAQTICEICHGENTLLSSFFFSRTATGPGRDEGFRLIPTIACQMTVTVPEAKTTIVKQLEHDPMMLSYSMEERFKKLIFTVLRQSVAFKLFN